MCAFFWLYKCYTKWAYTNAVAQKLNKCEWRIAMEAIDEKVLHEGKVKIYKRGKHYYVRMYEGNRRYKIESLKTTNIDEAEKLANDKYWELTNAQKRGYSTRRKSFNTVIDEYVEERTENYESNKFIAKALQEKDATSEHMLRQITRVVRFWREYCGNKAVEDIDDSVMRGYVIWRKNYYKNKTDRHSNTKINPAAKTLQWEYGLGKSIIKWAENRGYRGSAVRSISYVYRLETKIQRATFTIEEYRELYKALRRNVLYKQNNFKSAEQIYTANLLRDYVLILANTGMRVGEANSLTRNDVVEFKDKDGRKNYRFYVTGKTGRRVVVGRTNTVRYVERVIQRNKERDDELKNGIIRKGKATHRKYRTDKNNQWFFCMYAGEQIVTLIDQFDAVIKKEQIAFNRDEQKFSLYSLRHFYAEMMIRKSPEMLWDIARNMGTGIKQLQIYYTINKLSDASETRLGG